MPKLTRPHHETVLEHLRDPRAAAYYLNGALEESDELFLSALRDVAEAHDDPMTKLAEAANVKRASLYRMLKGTGNPTYQSLTNILRALGLRIAIEADIKEAPVEPPEASVPREEPKPAATVANPPTTYPVGSLGHLLASGGVSTDSWAAMLAATTKPISGFESFTPNYALWMKSWQVPTFDLSKIIENVTAPMAAVQRRLAEISASAAALENMTTYLQSLGPNSAGVLQAVFSDDEPKRSNVVEITEYLRNKKIPAQPPRSASLNQPIPNLRQA